MLWWTQVGTTTNVRTTHPTRPCAWHSKWLLWWSWAQSKQIRGDAINTAMKGTTKVIAAVLQQTYSKTSKKISHSLFSLIVSKHILVFYENLYFCYSWLMADGWWLMAHGSWLGPETGGTFSIEKKIHVYVSVYILIYLLLMRCDYTASAPRGNT